MLLPFPPAFPTRSLPGEGRSSPALLTPSPRQRGHTGLNGPGVWVCGAAASWLKRSMDSLFVEEVAASLVREFLSRKGLRKTSVTMDQERPRSDLSINSRNDLRKVLHLEFLYKENKAKENPLKTNLELITRYFLDHFGNIGNSVTQETPIPELSVPKKSNKLPLRSSETTLVNIYHLADEDESWRTPLSEISKARHDSLDGDVLGHFVSSKRSSHKSRPIKTVPGERPPVASAWEKMDKLPMSEPSLDTKRMGEKVRPKSGLIVRGMMAGPMASSPQDSLRRRSLRRSPALSSSTQPHKEGSPQEPELSTHTPTCPTPLEGPASSTASTPRSPRGLLSELTWEKRRTSPGSPPHLPGKGVLPRGSGRWRDLSEDSPAVDSGSEAIRITSKFSLSNGNVPKMQERPERALQRQESQPPSLRKNQLSVSNKVEGDLDVLQLEDVEDELVREEIILSPVSSVLKLQVVSKPIDLSVAKGGPCGVLAAVQGCVLQKLLFEGDSSADCARLQPSNARRTHCLALAIADIVWRAGGRERAVVTLASGTQHFSPTGKYKADGVLETLILHSLTCYEELVTFLQQSIHQFEAGPYGCVLLTLSAILSRSTELVRQDFDVPTSHLIGAHGYCTQELVNLLLTGKAVSNVFNDVVELDSGNGNITLLKGISTRSDIGFLSLFEHYNVCQTPPRPSLRTETTASSLPLSSASEPSGRGHQ
ncbi:probable ubiquitin carboxyl-terminal hydrolase MINDY-4 isoform X4 [Ovis canadensis]|uniref:probable ubiquitin carboxyl-terminal hydrolase MINDY-4 isoform X4 n=1 Tax=Ovis canadensis TaxID=37174 RepID=UPI003751627B